MLTPDSRPRAHIAPWSQGSSQRLAECLGGCHPAEGSSTAAVEFGGDGVEVVLAVGLVPGLAASGHRIVAVVLAPRGPPIQTSTGDPGWRDL
jgi:hypothetical protein